MSNQDTARPKKKKRQSRRRMAPLKWVRPPPPPAVMSSGSIWEDPSVPADPKPGFNYKYILAFYHPRPEEGILDESRLQLATERCIAYNGRRIGLTADEISKGWEARTYGWEIWELFGYDGEVVDQDDVDALEVDCMLEIDSSRTERT
ncbi:hypothetical protein OC842_007672 [Tilletia horrida]|uniref:Uncharacterized protein n=1 Tax=Tilletia horrida TaxID=155126 RepID=A0AAN6G3P9_9BASI|nr:hypothetical protein OC842_007672 [Tilletia horrida]